jgi:RNA polymerase sigma factor (sigma-70 family)
MNDPSSKRDPADETTEATDALSERARAGGRAEIEELYVRTLPALLAWIQVHKSGGLGARVDPADLAQEVWLRVLEGFPRFDGAIGSFRGWMLGIAKFVWLEHTNPRRRGSAPRLAGETQLSNVPDTVTTATRAFARDDSLQRFVEHVEKLDAVDRMVLVHHGLEQMTCEEVGVRLAMSADAISKRWQRLQARMRDLGIGRDLVFDE